jgi:hypothetical protein
VALVQEAPAPPPEKVPIGQALVGTVSPVVAQYDPAVHEVHEVAPVEEENDPTAHAVGAVRVPDGQYDPAGHGVQAEVVAPPAEYDPAEQAPVTAESPVVEQ